MYYATACQAKRRARGLWIIASIALVIASGCADKKEERLQERLREQMDALLSQPVTLAEIESESNKMPGWSRIIIFAPYQRKETFESVAKSSPRLAKDLYDISCSLEQWSLVTVDASDRIISKHAIAWRQSPTFVVRELTRSP